VPRTPSTVLTALAGLILVAACADRVPVAPDSAPAALPPVRNIQPLNRHLIVITGEDAASPDLLGRLAEYGAVVERDFREIGVLSVSGLSDAEAAEIRGLPEVEGIDRDLLVQWVPGDVNLQVVNGPTAQSDQSGAAFFDDQWNIRQIRADAAWDVSNQGAGVKVGILDTGLDPTHLDLQGRVDLANSASALTPGTSPCNAFLGLPDEETFTDFRFHGTFVGALVTSNGIGTASVAPDAELVGIKVLNCNGSGSFGDLIFGIVLAVDARVDVINMSLGALLPNDPSIEPLRIALQRAVAFAAGEHGVLMVAAAGNDAVDLDEGSFIHLPSMLEGVMAVSATAPTNQMNFDQLASYSNFGVAGVTVAAPGGDLVTGGVSEDLILAPCSSFSVFFNCGSGGAYLLSAGTSFASPHVAGVAAVLESSIAGNQFPNRLATCIFRGAVHVDGLQLSPFYGRGRVDILASLREPGCGGAIAD